VKGMRLKVDTEGMTISIKLSQAEFKAMMLAIDLFLGDCKTNADFPDELQAHFGPCIATWNRINESIAAELRTRANYPRKRDRLQNGF
jgi:hypothetical protein